MSEMNVPFIVCEAFVTLVAFVGNLIVILAFFLDRKVRSVRNYHILSLSVADFLTSTVGIPLYLWSLLTHLPEDFQLCLVVNSFILILCAVSILSLIAISLDRFLSIVTPIRYREKMNAKLVGGMILLAWILGCVIGLLPLMGWNLGRPHSNSRSCTFIEVIDLRYLVFLYFATVLGPLVFLFGIYCKIFNVIRQRQNQKLSSVKCREDSQEKIQQRKDIHASKIIATIIIVFALSWVPLYTINTVIHFCSTCRVPETLILVAIWLTHFNSAVNPFLYAIGLREIRSAIGVVLRVCRRAPKQHVKTQTNGTKECVSLKPSIWEVSVTAVNKDGVLETDFL